MIKKIFKNKQIVMVIALILGLIISYYVNRYVFLSNTPRVNSQFIAHIRSAPFEFTAAVLSRQNNSGTGNKISSYSIQQLQNATYKQVSQGVYAADVGELKVYKFSESQTEWSTITLKKKSGKSITLRYPKNNPPTQQMLDIIKSQ